jgi:hypothetical protein
MRGQSTESWKRVWYFTFYFVGYPETRSRKGGWMRILTRKLGGSKSKFDTTLIFDKKQFLVLIARNYKKNIKVHKVKG